MLSVENVSYVYESGTPALEHVSLEIKEGEFLCIVGQNGSGASLDALNRALADKGIDLV